MKSLLICHEGADFDHVGLAGWLASFSELAGIVVLRERPGRGRQRIKREIKRSGLLGFADVVAFRLYYKLRSAGPDAEWEAGVLRDLSARYPVPADVPQLITHSPNTPEAIEFVRRAAPDITLARCKTLLKPAAFELPSVGTFVLHPGMCPEYRNAHGGFWALANGEPEKVAVSLLKIDVGVDTGPVYGYFTYPFDPIRESHIVIQQKCVTENLDAIRDKFRDVVAGQAEAIDVTGRESATYGQPWLTRHLKMQRRLKKGLVP